MKTKYKGMSSLDTGEPKLKEIAKQALLEALKQAIEKYVNQQKGLTKKHLQIAHNKICNEIESPVSEIANYFKRNLGKKLSNRTVYQYGSRPRHVKNEDVLPKNRLYFQKVYNEELIQKFLKGNKEKLVISMSTSGSATRITNVLTNIINDTKESGFDVLLVVGVNETLDNTVDLVLKFAKKRQIATITNEVPPGSLKGYSVQNRTTSLNLNLYVIREQYGIKDAYLAVIDDDILFPVNRGKNLKELASFLDRREIKVTSATSVPYPTSFFDHYSNKKNIYYHPIFYETLTHTYTIDLQTNIPPRPNVHGGCMLMKLKDHPLYAPLEETFHDLWLTEYFQKGSVLRHQAMRCNKIFIYHHEPTCLISWIAKWDRILKMIQPYKQNNPKMDKEVNRLINLRFLEIIKNLSNDKQELAAFILYELTKQKSLELYSR